MNKRQFISAVLAAVLCLGMVAEADAQPGNRPARQIASVKPIIANYDVYVGGIHLLTGSALFDQKAGRYHALVRAQTQGFWYKLFPWNAEVAAQGRLTATRFLPTTYRDYNLWNKKPKTVRMYFDSKGNIRTLFEPESHDQNRESVTPAQKRGALDPISGLLQMLANVAVRKSCDQKVPVFDGKRRFDLISTDTGSDNIDDREYGIYKGDARLCDVEFTMVAGDWKDKDPTKGRFWQHTDGEKGREPFHVWLASPAPGLPELPIRLESGSFWGLVVIHLSGWHPASSAELKP